MRADSLSSNNVNSKDQQVLYTFDAHWREIFLEMPHELDLVSRQIAKGKMENQFLMDKNM